MTIDGFEETQKEERKQKVQALIEEMAPNYGVKPEDLPIADKWLLKSTSQKTITQEIGEQMKTLANLYKERDEIVKKCMKNDLAPAPYIEMHKNGMSYIDVTNTIEADLIDRENTADLFKQAKQAKAAEQKAAMVDIGDGRLVDENGADFPNCVAYGKTAENLANYVHKGEMVGVTGCIRTGSYTNKDGQKVYTTDVSVASVQFLNSRSSGGQNNGYQNNGYGYQNNGYQSNGNGYQNNGYQSNGGYQRQSAPNSTNNGNFSQNNAQNAQYGFDENDLPF